MVIHKDVLIVATQSEVRLALLRSAGVEFAAQPARIDEASLKQSMIADGLSPRDIADALAEAKAGKISRKVPSAFVVGADQILLDSGAILSKPTSAEDLKARLQRQSGRSHSLIAAVVIYHNAAPVWRHVSEVKMHMRTLSDAFIEDYVDRGWPELSASVGGYFFERDGVRLFEKVEGCYHSILGLPLLPLLSYLGQRGIIET